MKIEDNLLEQKKFDEIQTAMMREDFPWFFNDDIDYKGQKDRFQFTHLFYADNSPRSTFVDLINPILKIIEPISLWRIKANLLTITPNIVENDFHIDMGGISNKKLKQWTTSIFYVNTNDGYTKFEDDTKVESVANRMVTFPSNMKHTGTSCTDEKTRVLINFNYFK